jgi:hypothetical protein
VGKRNKREERMKARKKEATETKTRRELYWGEVIWGPAHQPTYGRTDGQTDQQTDKVYYRDAMFAPKKNHDLSQ